MEVRLPSLSRCATRLFTHVIVAGDTYILPRPYGAVYGVFLI